VSAGRSELTNAERTRSFFSCKIEQNSVQPGGIQIAMSLVLSAVNTVEMVQKLCDDTKAANSAEHRARNTEPNATRGAAPGDPPERRPGCVGGPLFESPNVPGIGHPWLARRLVRGWPEDSREGFVGMRVRPGMAIVADGHVEAVVCPVFNTI